mgnify:CR=1 FL=1
MTKPSAVVGGYGSRQRRVGRRGQQTGDDHQQDAAHSMLVRTFWVAAPVLDAGDVRRRQHHHGERSVQR